jgi:hypothetical protein
MSSILSNTASAAYLPHPEPVCLITFSSRKPIPFFFDKKTDALDVAFVNGFTESSSISGTNEDYWTRANLQNGTQLVTKVGANFKTWYETAYNADAGSISVYEPGIVVKANIVVPYFEPDSNSSFSSERTQPISYESAAGNEESDYLATLLFKKPLVITYTKSGIRYYRGFATLWAEGNT